MLCRRFHKMNLKDVKSKNNKRWRSKKESCNKNNDNRKDKEKEEFNKKC